MQMKTPQHISSLLSLKPDATNGPWSMPWKLAKPGYFGPVWEGIPKPGPFQRTSCQSFPLRYMEEGHHISASAAVTVEDGDRGGLLGNPTPTENLKFSAWVSLLWKPQGVLCTDPQPQNLLGLPCSCFKFFSSAAFPMLTVFLKIELALGGRRTRLRLAGLCV